MLSTLCHSVRKDLWNSGRTHGYEIGISGTSSKLMTAVILFYSKHVSGAPIITVIMDTTLSMCQLFTLLIIMVPYFDRLACIFQSICTHCSANWIIFMNFNYLFIDESRMLMGQECFANKSISALLMPGWPRNFLVFYCYQSIQDAIIIVLHKYTNTSCFFFPLIKNLCSKCETSCQMRLNGCSHARTSFKTVRCSFPS